MTPYSDRSREEGPNPYESPSAALFETVETPEAIDEETADFFRRYYRMACLLTLTICGTLAGGNGNGGDAHKALVVLGAGADSSRPRKRARASNTAYFRMFR